MNSRHQETLEQFEIYHIWVDELDHDKHWQLGYGGGKEKPVIKIDYWPNTETLMWAGVVMKLEPKKVIEWLLADKFQISQDRILKQTVCRQCGDVIYLVKTINKRNEEKSGKTIPINQDGSSHFHKPDK